MELEKGIQEVEFARNKLATSGYMQVSSCQGNHRYFVAETFAVEGEGTVGAIIICTACGESKVISHKVARAGSSVSLKLKEK
jgi:hypothetical protein